MALTLAQLQTFKTAINGNAAIAAERATGDHGAIAAHYNANMRAGFTSIFGAGTSLTNLTAIAQKVPTRFEALYTTSNVCALFGYVATAADVAAALAS